MYIVLITCCMCSKIAFHATDDAVWRRAASEIAYVLDDLTSGNAVPIDAKDEEVARMMNAYWTNFAKTGNPNGDGLRKMAGL